MTYADRDRYGMYKDSDSAGPGPALMGADTLIGDSVVNGEDDNLGDIKEIMLDMRNGQVAYAVLAFGGFLGMGEKLFAVPWQALQLDTVNKRFVLNVDKERLKNAPGFNADAWPDMSDVGWANQIHTFYGTDPNSSGMMGGGVPMGGMVGGAGRGAGMGAGMGAAMGSGMGGAGSGMSSGAGSEVGGDLGTSSSGGSMGTSGGSGLGSSDLGTSDLGTSRTTVIKPGSDTDI
ncbi:MAG: PRC-barrel domain-containing protein [Massilia sp.]